MKIRGYPNNISPLRYPGSKQKLIPYIEKILVYNCISPEILVEPFVGGGSVFLSLIINGNVEKAVIADKDILIYSFWLTLFKKPQVLIDFINKVKIDLKTFYGFKSIAKDPCSSNHDELAKACLFLNRTSFSGVIAPSSGPIGGVLQKSEYSIGCRFNRESLCEKIAYISAFSKQITILPFGWRKTIDHCQKKLKNKYSIKKQLYYFDPPFYRKAQELYRTYFTDVQHQELAKFLQKFKSIWLLSYDNVPEIKEIYKCHRGKPFNIQIPYSINSHAKRIAHELIITPMNLPSSNTK